MQQELPIEERVAILEEAVADLRRQQQNERDIQDMRDAGLLARTDEALEGIKRVERITLRTYNELKTDHQELKTLVQGLVTEVKAQGESLDLTIQNTNVLAEGVAGHKIAIETVAGRVEQVASQIGELTSHVTGIATVQHKILALLGGGQDQQKKTND